MALRVTEKYVKLCSDFEKLKIIGVLLGGSTLYRHQELDPTDIATDWDGIILVKEKTDIVDLVNNFRSELCDLLEIKQEEYPKLKVPSEEVNINIFNCFDGVRFAGRTAKNIKKGTKILSLDYFKRILKENNPSHLNILSFKDVRVLDYKTNYDKSKQYRIQQATRVDENLVILHDMDIFIYEHYKPGSYAAIFGATADLLMTGTWIYDNDSHSDQVVRELFLKFCRLHVELGLQQVNLPLLFKSHSQFHPAFCENLKKRLKSYTTITNDSLPSIKLILKCDENPWQSQRYFWGKAADFKVFKNSIKKTDIFKSPITADSSTFHLLQNQHFSPFSSNSQYGYCVFHNRKLFWKRTKFIKDELVGSELVLQFYYHTQVPVMVDYQNHVVFYPFFNGELLSDIRLKIAKQEFRSNGHADLELGKKILTLELQRSADILNAFCLSAKVLKGIQGKTSIHRFFYDRLMEDSRLREFYEAGFELSDARYLTIEDLKHTNLLINSHNYGKLSQIILKATQLLNPKSFYNEVVISGLGDGHSGNLLVENTQQENTTHKYLYIDYEVSEWHSPMLDLAKPFFIDVFFNLVYADLFTSSGELFRRGVVQVQLTDDKSTLKIDLNLPKSFLSNGIYEIKMRYLLLPFIKFIENHKELQPNCNWPLIFGHALFTCAILTRNYSKRTDIFFATLALGVICTDIKTFKENEKVFEMINDMLCMG